MSWVRQSNIVQVDDPWYNNPKYHAQKIGYSINIKGSPFKERATVLCNCTGFANGAYCETYIKSKYGENESNWPKNRFPYHFRGLAKYCLDSIRIQSGHKPIDFPEDYTGNKTTSIGNWGDNTIASLYDWILPVTAKPPQGGIIVWGGPGQTCHIAFIKSVHSEDKITILQAGYGVGSWSTEYPSSSNVTGYKCNEFTTTRNFGGSGKTSENLFWYQNGISSSKHPNPKCLGFIANPAVGIGTQIVISPSITSINSIDYTSINISGCKNDTSSFVTTTRLYYKYNGQVSLTSYDGKIDVTDYNFSVNIIKPLTATNISVLPVNVDVQSNTVSGEIATRELRMSSPTLTIVGNEEQLLTATPHIYTDEGWKEAIPTIKKDGGWYKLYNTHTEKL